MNLVGKVQVRIINRIKSFAIAAGVGIGKPGSDFVRLFVDNSFVLFGYGLPLAWSGIQTQITIGGDPQSVLDNDYAALMTFWVNILKGHHAEARHFEILLLVQLQRRSLRVLRRLREKQEQNCECRDCSA